MNAAVLLLLALPAFAQDAPDPNTELDESAVRGLVTQYRKSEHWALRCVILSSLGARWHPAGAEMIGLAFNDKDRRVRAYALEALRRADGETLRAAATVEVMASLITKQFSIEDKLFHDRVLEVLRAAAPEATVGRNDWVSWWTAKKDGWAPKGWSAKTKKALAPSGAPEPGHTGMTQAEQFVERAFDLNLAGLEIAICIDATGSMQPTIDASRDAVKDVVAVLRGITPKFRMGIVWYRDYDVGKKGAEVAIALTEDLNAVYTKLKGLNASGGGDFPERVEKGLEFALAPAMGWQAGTNKVVLIVGDAPPHDEDIAKTKEMAKKAREGPAPAPGGGGADVPTGPNAPPPKPKARGIITSTLGVGLDTVAPATVGAFQGIAEAGGGSYGQLLIGAKGAKDSESNTDQIIGHILTSCFGEAWAAPAREFVRIYLEYRKAKFFPG